jgi:hypothetical protein
MGQLEVRFGGRTKLGACMTIETFDSLFLGIQPAIFRLGTGLGIFKRLFCRLGISSLKPINSIP